MGRAYYKEGKQIYQFKKELFIEQKMFFSYFNLKLKIKQKLKA